MSTSTPVVSDFTAGELSPFLFGQSNQPVYHKGASAIQNFVPKAMGGFYKRPGTLFCGHTYTNLPANIIPFIVSQGTAYVLEFTNQLVRIWKNGVEIGNVVTAAMPGGLSPYLTADLQALNVAPSFPDLFITHQTYPPARIRWTSPDTLTMIPLTYFTNTVTFTGTSVNGSPTITLVSTNLVPVESTWLITGPGVPGSTYLTAIAPTTGSTPLSWTATMNNNAGAGAGAGTFTLTLQPATPFGSAGNYPRSCQVSFQRLWLMNTTNNPQEIWQTEVGVYSQSADPLGTAGTIGLKWSDISSFSVNVMQTNSDGSPTTNPATFLATPTFQDVVNAENAGDYTINSPRDDEIYWAVPIVDMLIGSAYGEWIVPSASNPTNFTANQISAVTDFPVQPLLVSGGVILVQKLGKRVYRVDWQGAQNPFPPPQDLTFFAEHLFSNNPIVDFDVQFTPDCYLWYMRTDGTLAVLVYNQSMGVMAWWRFVTNGTVVSLCVVPGADLQGITDRDVMYLCVKRGASYTIEQVASPYWTNQAQAVFSDCAVYKTQGTPFATMVIDASGGLNGLTFEMVVNGVYAGTAVVTGGSLTIPAAFVPAAGAMTVVAGLNFYSLVTSMPLVPQDAEGTGQLKKSAIPKSRFRLYNSLYMKAGQFLTPNASGNSPLTNVKMGDTGIGGVTIDATHPSAPFPTPYSGYARCGILEGLRDDAYLNIVSDLPLPCSVTTIVPDVEDVETGR